MIIATTPTLITRRMSTPSILKLSAPTPYYQCIEAEPEFTVCFIGTRTESEPNSLMKLKCMRIETIILSTLLKQ